MAVENLIIKLRVPATVYLGDQGNGDGVFALDGVRCRTGFPPWPAAADLLFNRGTRELCGVTYQVAPEFRRDIRELAKSLDHTCTRYVDGERESRPPAYDGEPEDIHYFEITWSETRPDAMALAQVGGDFWYYFIDELGRATQVERVVGYGLADLGELLREHQLELPRQLALPSTLTVRDLSSIGSSRSSVGP